MTISGHMLRMAAAAAQADGAIPSVPGTPYGGGFYFGDITIGSDVYALIVADKSAEVTRLWKTTRSATAGTSSESDGWANTNAMNDANHPAAQYCRAYSAGGFSDWYLWAADELALAYADLSPGGASTPALFKTGGAQAFNASPNYWSSTQSTSNTSAAISRSMSTGTIGNNFKDSNFTVRPIRRVKRN